VCAVSTRDAAPPELIRISTRETALKRRPMNFSPSWRCLFLFVMGLILSGIGHDVLSSDQASSSKKFHACPCDAILVVADEKAFEV
jgi:hypothetical protein